MASAPSCCANRANRASRAGSARKLSITTSAAPCPAPAIRPASTDWQKMCRRDSYTVAYWKGSASAPESEYAYKTGIASTATSQELTNLESNTSYWAKVKAVGSLDSDWSETANATTMDSGGEPLLPTADLLDVVFRNDGSAMDNSSSATPVRRMPSSRP